MAPRRALATATRSRPSDAGQRQLDFRREDPQLAAVDRVDEDGLRVAQALGDRLALPNRDAGTVEKHSELVAAAGVRCAENPQ